MEHLNKNNMTKGIFSKVLVSICIILTILFICAVLFLNYTNHDVDAALIYSTFAFFTSEVLAMAGIRCSKNKYTNVVDDNFGDSGVNTSNRDNVYTDDTDDDSDISIDTNEDMKDDSDEEAVG